QRDGTAVAVKDPEQELVTGIGAAGIPAVGAERGTRHNADGSDRRQHPLTVLVVSANDQCFICEYWPIRLGWQDKPGAALDVEKVLGCRGQLPVALATALDECFELVAGENLQMQQWTMRAKWSCIAPPAVLP